MGQQVISASSAAGADSGLKQILYQRRLAEARARVAALLASAEGQSVRTKVKKEVDEGRLSVRADRELWADVGTRHNIANLLLCYHPAWLRLGLEALYARPPSPPRPRRCLPPCSSSSSRHALLLCIPVLHSPASRHEQQH